MSFRHKNKRWSAYSRSPSHRFPLKPEVKYCDWSKSNRNPDSFVPVGDLPWPVGKQTKESLPHRKLSKAFDWCCVRLLIPWVFTLPSALFTALSKTSFQLRNVVNFNSQAYRTYRGRVFSQQFLTKHMRPEQKRKKLVSNRTDSSVSVDEPQIKKSRRLAEVPSSSRLI